MQDKFIIKLLGIEDKHVELWDVDESESKLQAWVTTKVKTQKCPKCKARTRKVHAYFNQTVESIGGLHKPLTLHIKKRRYKCKSCQATFMEKLGFIKRYQRCLSVLPQTALIAAGKASFAHASMQYNISSQRLIRQFDRMTIKTPKVLPEVLAIDEFKGDAGGEKFQTVIVDADNRKVIDVLPDRKKETIISYLRSCDTGQVRAVVMDLSRGFKEAVRAVLGNPIIIADRFHYMRQVYNAFDDVRREVQNELSDEERKHMKRSKEMLWKSRKKITSETKEKVDKMLSISSKLKDAYELKDELDDWFKNSDLHTAKGRFDKCIEKLENSPYESFNRVARTFRRWRLEILNSFSHLYNNGVTEGINNMIKVIKRHSFGIKDFQRFRKKILWYQEVKEMTETL